LSKVKTIVPKEEIKAKVDALYPEGNRKFVGDKMAEARKFIGSLMENGSKEEKKHLGEALKVVVMRAARDAVAEELDLRASAHTYFDNVRDRGTPEEKELALCCLRAFIEDELKKTYLQMDVNVIMYAAEMLVYLGDPRGAKTVRKAAERLRKYAAFTEETKTLEGLAAKLDKMKKITPEAAIEELVKSRQLVS